MTERPASDFPHRGLLPLWCGIGAGPLYLLVGVGQGLVRDGFDFTRHPLSVLANGPGGWIQTANFVVTGVMVGAAAFGLRRALGPTARGLAGMLAGCAAGLIVAAACPADPVDGFPPGTLPGAPTTISTSGLVHFLAGTVTFTCLGLSGLLAARTMGRRRARALSVLSGISGLTVLFGFFGGILGPLGIRGIWLAVVAGWAWLSLLSFNVATSERAPADVE